MIKLVDNSVDSASGPEGLSARICAVDGWRELPPHRLAVACLRCEIRIGHELDELGMHTGKLRVEAHDPPIGARIPLRIDAYDLALPGRLHDPLGPLGDQIGFTPVATVLAKWVQAWRSWDCQPGAVRSYASVWMVTRWFRERLSWACRVYDGLPEFASVVRQQLHAVRQQLGINDSAERLPLPCVHCGASALTRQWPIHAAASASFVECGECEWWWDEAEYAGVKVRQLMSAIPPDTMLTAAEIAIARPGVLAANVRDWKRRRRLAPVPGPWGGRAVYILAEVDQLITGVIAARLARHQAQQEMIAA